MRIDVQAGDGRLDYVWAAVAVAVIALTGFARTYFLRGLSAGAPLPFALHLHGVVMSLWCALFVTQTCLIAAKRVDVHRRVGIVGVALAISVAALSAYVTISAAVREVGSHAIGQFHFLLGFNLVNVLVFSVLFCAALALRRRPDFHKRLMLLSTLSLLPPAAARVTLLFGHNDLAQLLAFDSCVLIFPVVDTIRYRRVHPAFGWGVLLILGTLNAAFVAFQSDVWTDFVTRVLSW